MKTTKITKLLGATMVAAILLLTGCGGGGGAGSNSTTTTPAVTTPNLKIVLTELASGTTTNSISLDKPIKATATVLDANQKPVANAVVSFTVNPSTLVAIKPTSASVLSDANGVAFVQLAAASISSAGAGTVSASATVDSTSVSGSANFNVGAASIGLSDLTTGTTSLAAYGTTSVTVKVTGVSSSYPVTVEFTSTCAASGKATLTSSVQSVGGIATANYTDNKCATTDTITASVAGTSASISTTLAVQVPSMASIQFVSATPETIVLKGTGSAGFQESSLVKFKVVDNNNQGVANADIKLYLSLNTGGILIDSSSTAISLATAITKQTDANGEIQVSVQSGTVPTPVWVNAEASSTLKTQSSKLTISTGRPTQDRFSLAVKTHNIEGFSYNGVTTSVEVIASDRLGNPVPDGTTVNFIAGGGQIGASCQTALGACSVTFTSANPRLTGNVGIVAYTIGEESFYDSNNNNTYDTGEPFTDLGNVFLNRDGRLSFDATADQQIIYSSASGACASPMATSPTAPAVPSTCDLVWGNAHVRQGSIVIMSGSDAFVVRQGTTTESADKCTTTTVFKLFDVNNNPMPFATTIATSETSLGSPVFLTATVLDSVAVGGTSHTVTLTRTPVAPATTCTSIVGSTLPLVITTPKGNISSPSLTI